MINPKDIRIGNLLEWEDGEKNIVEVSVISRIGVVSWHHKTNTYSTDVKHLNPIPLTEEWLLKLGFKNQLNRTLSINLGDWIIEVDFDFMDGSYLVEVFDNEDQEAVTLWNKTIKHVHQLQNLCYSLTGEEISLIETHTA